MALVARLLVSDRPGPLARLLKYRGDEGEWVGETTVTRSQFAGARRNAHGMGWMAALVAAAAGAGCAHRIPLESGPGGYGSNGRVTVVDRHYGIRVVKVQIDALVDPRKVAPLARTYVVWASQWGLAVENVGAMHMRADRGVLEAVAPSGKFHLFVTAETSADATAPSNRPIFFANVGD